MTQKELMKTIAHKAGVTKSQAEEVLVHIIGL